MKQVLNALKSLAAEAQARPRRIHEPGVHVTSVLSTTDSSVNAAGNEK